MSSDPIEVLRRMRDGWAAGQINEDEKAALDAALASLSAPKPEGEWVLVPREPTDAMVVAFAESWFSTSRAIDDPEMEDAYAAMLAAAPKPPPMNDNAVAVNESPDVNDKPESAEAVCPDCHGEGGRRWYEADGSERGETCGTCDGFGTALQQASAPVGVEGFDAWWKSHSIDPEFPETMDDRTFAKAAWDAALAQQPAAMDGAAPLTERQAVIVTGYTGVLCSSFDAFHADLEKRAGRPVLTHEMADFGWIKPLYRDDFLGLAGQQQGETP